MTALRKGITDGAGSLSGYAPSEAFEYQDDVTEEAVRALQEKANALSDPNDEWVVIEGYGAE